MKRIKLQKIGNSLRATIPREVADDLGLRQGQSLLLDVKDGTILIRKEGSRNMSRFHGALHLTEKVEKWPVPSEMKDIWH